MAVYDTFKKRQKRELGDVTDVYTYDKIPRSLKVQIIHIWREVIGQPSIDLFGNISEVANIYQAIVQILRKEYASFRLSKDTYNEHDLRYAFKELCEFFLLEKPAEDDLSIIELPFRFIDNSVRMHSNRGDELADDAVTELNTKFNEHAIGYQFIGNSIIRRDSEYMHVEATKPVLTLLNDPIYKAAQEEFLSAHEHYRHGATVEFSSTLANPSRAL